MARKIEVLGAGCPKCKQAIKIMEMAVQELGIDAVIEKVQDIDEIIINLFNLNRTIHTYSYIIDLFSIL